jgi:hypothetical protein
MLTASVALTEALFHVAVITAWAVAFTAVVPKVNVADADPAGIVTDVGSSTAEDGLERATLAPPGPATPFSETVPVEPIPPTTELGFNEID